MNDDNPKIGYNNLILYYFSGTGNAKNTAEWIQQCAIDAGLKTRLVNMDRASMTVVPAMPEGKTLVGFIYPTHGFNAPPLVLKVIRKFPRKKGDAVFLANTRGGLKLSKIFLPGISGVALLVPALLLWLKGYPVVAMRPVDLPSNWISLHPGLKKNVINSIYTKWKAKIALFSKKLLAGKRMYPNLVQLPIDLFCIPISFGYYVIGRFMLAKTFIATKDCNACGLCEKRCPTQSIIMVNDLPYWKYSCESCMRCMNQCPKRAIQTSHSISIMMWYLLWSLLPAMVISIILKQDGMSSFTTGWRSSLLYYFVAVPLGFLMIWLSYHVLHYLLRYRWINRLVSVTSFTSFRFWRRYQAPQGF